MSRVNFLFILGRPQNYKKVDVSRKGAKARRTDDGGRRREEGGGKTEKGEGFGDFRFRSTFDIIEAAKKGLLPDKMMINTHPQRWDDRLGPGPGNWSGRILDILLKKSS